VKIAIVGSRDFNNYELLKKTITDFLFTNRTDEEFYEMSYKDHTIVSGGAKGADMLAERFADEFELEKIIFKPDWDLYGKSAGFKRNKDIIRNADVVFAFWDGKSKGTQHSINLAKEMDKELYIIQ